MKLKKAGSLLLSAAILLGSADISAFSVDASAASALTISGGDENNHFEDKRENYVNSYFSYKNDKGEEIQIGTIINTVTFEFPSVSDMGLEIYGLAKDEYVLMNAVDVSGTTSYEYDFWLGGSFKARLVEDGTAGEWQSFTVEIPDADGDGSADWDKDWGFISYVSNELLSGSEKIDISGFKVPFEDFSEPAWKTWNKIYAISDWNGIFDIDMVGIEYDRSETLEYVPEIRINGYNTKYEKSKRQEYLAYITYLRHLVDTLLPPDEYFTDLEKAVILYNYFCEFIGNPYGESGNAFASLWYKEALCNGCAKGFSLLCQLAGLNCIKGGSGVSAHAWNIVQINGEWYQVDPLWGINNPSQYFLRTDEEFIEHHNGNTDITYGKSPIYWAHTLTDAFPDCTDKTFQDEKYIFRKASAQIFYNDGYFYYYVSENGKYDVYKTSDLTDTGEKIESLDNPDDFYKYLPDPEPYLYVSDKNAETGKAVYLSAGAAYYTNPGDTSNNKYKGLDVRLTVPGAHAVIGAVTDYTFEIYDSESSLIDTIQGAMYSISSYVFKKAGAYTIKAVAESENGKSASVTETITVTGEDVVEYVVWANGGKQKLEDGSSINHKNAEIKTELEATSWTDSKGSIKAGKIVWTSLITSGVPAVDKEKHTVTTKSDKSVVTVSNGKLTAKSGGESGESAAYIYATDTGSLESELFAVTVKNAPSAIFLFDDEEKTAEDKKDKLKSVAVVAGGESAKIYITSYAKQGKVSDDCTYTITAKKNDDGIISFTDIKTDENGKMYFEVSGNKIEKAGKPSKISLTVTCDQSAKKATLAVNVISPVKGVALSGSGSVKEKGDTADLSVKYTLTGENTITSDKIKVFVAASDPVVDESGKKATIVKSKEITAKLSKDMTTLTLKASKPVTEAQNIYFIVTNPATKLVTWYKAGEIAADGTIKTSDSDKTDNGETENNEADNSGSDTDETENS